MTNPRRTRGTAPVESMAPLAAALPWGPKAGVARDVAPRTLAGQTAQRLREDIIRNRLEPGERLTIQKLVRRYGVGTSPLREALFQVASDGLVRVEDHKGFVVASLSLGEMQDVSSLRAYLEINALRRSIEQGGEEWEAAVLTAAHRLAKADARLVDAKGGDLLVATDEWETRHRAFHYALCSACGSPWLLHFFDALYDQLERYRRRLWHYEDRVADAGNEHEQIRDAALARQGDVAVKLLSEHFRRQAVLTTVPSSPAAGRSEGAAAGAPPRRPTRAKRPVATLMR